jgi:hypothetical protein
MSSLAILAVAAIVQSPWVLVAIPPLVVLLLLGPPLGVFRHDETLAPRTGLYLDARLPEDESSGPGARFLLTLVNPGDVVAEDFRIRIVIPPELSPRDGPLRPLGHTFIGQYGAHWFIESVYDATAITFRSGAPGEPGAIQCEAGARRDLAELRFINRGRLAGATIEYQISGGTAKAVLGQLELPETRDEPPAG